MSKRKAVLPEITAWIEEVTDTDAPARAELRAAEAVIRAARANNCPTLEVRECLCGMCRALARLDAVTGRAEKGEGTMSDDLTRHLENEAALREIASLRAEVARLTRERDRECERADANFASLEWVKSKYGTAEAECARLRHERYEAVTHASRTDAWRAEADRSLHAAQAEVVGLRAEKWEAEAATARAESAEAEVARLRRSATTAARRRR